VALIDKDVLNHQHLIFYDVQNQLLPLCAVPDDCSRLIGLVNHRSNKNCTELSPLIGLAGSIGFLFFYNLPTHRLGSSLHTFTAMSSITSALVEINTTGLKLAAVTVVLIFTVCHMTASCCDES